MNPRGPVDRSVPVLRIDAPDGSLRGVLFGCACHGTTLTGGHAVISGDYAGAAQRFVEERHAGATAMFMAGCGGDANPYPRGKFEYVEMHGRELGAEVCRVLAAQRAPVGGPLRTAFGRAALPFQREQRGTGYHADVFRKRREMLQRGETPATHYEAPVAVWQFGADLTLVGIPGETVVDYVALTEKALGPLRLWVAGYCNDVMGYLPSARILAEGGYETRGTYYRAAPGIFAPEVERAVIGKIEELAREAGRALPGPGDVRRH